MTEFHIVLPRQMNLAEENRRAARREAPRHSMWELAKILNAAIHEPDESHPRTLDKARALVVPPANLWTLAERVRSATKPSDVVFCLSEAGGLQLAASYGRGEVRPHIALYVHNINRPRARLALRWWHIAHKIDLFLTISKAQADFLRSYLHLPDSRVRHILDHTDTRFFSPGPASSSKRRPVIASVGLEQRDYKTLAEATRDLEVDVRISGFSKDASAMARTFPDALPDNMSRRFYEWPELLQLYRDADVVVISCHANRYAAGVSSLIEGAACGRPIIATATEGLKGYLDENVIVVPPGNPPAMRQAILQALGDRPTAEARARRGYELAIKRYSMERYLSDITDAIRSLSS